MVARHQTEVVISPTIKSDWTKIIPARQPIFAKWARGRRQARVEQVEDAMQRYVREYPKSPVLLETMREEELIAKIRASSCQSLCNERSLP